MKLSNAQVAIVEKAYRYALKELDQFMPEVDCERLFSIAVSWFPVYQTSTRNRITLIGRASKKEYLETI